MDAGHLGQGPERGALEAQIAKLGLSGQARLRGLSAQACSWLHDADIFVLSSRYEGFPNVLGEAMAAGLPVAAVDCDFGPADMVEHARSGLLVSSDDENALAAAIETLIADPQLRAQLGQAARQAMQRFEASRVLRQWDALVMWPGERKVEAWSAMPILESS